MSMSSRRGRSLGRWGKRGLQQSGAAALARRAGQAGWAHADAAAAGELREGGIERLEERQLLYTVTITPGDVNPATGLGTIVTDFAYVVPFLNKELPEDGFAEFNDERVFGARVVFTGPVGATYTITDLYGRDMQERLDLLTPEGEEVSNVDLNDDGVPDFNDGIGKITITGTNSASSFSMLGGTVEDDGTGNIMFMPPDSVGLFHDFEDTGFGYFINPDGSVDGLPDAGGSLIIGSPFVRDNSSAAAYLGAAGSFNFTNADQGVFVTGDSNIGAVRLHAISHGQMTFSGAVGAVQTGILLGNVTVDGDMGELIVASDAGAVVSDDFQSTLPTGSQIVVGRTVREIAVAGRLVSDINVLGDIINTSRNRFTFRSYTEREFLYSDPTATPEDLMAAWVGSSGAVFGDTYFRNEALGSAEFVGYNGTAVTITGQIGSLDSVNTEDASDVYAFPAEKGKEIVAAALDSGASSRYMRIVDEFGRVVAAANGSDPSSSILRFTPDSTGIYYLIVHFAPDGAPMAQMPPYQISLSGMAAVTAGSVRAGSRADIGSLSQPSDVMLLQVFNGSLGSLRVGTGLIDSMLMQTVASINTPDDPRTSFTLGRASVSVAQHLYSLNVGSNILGASVNVGGNLGTVYTGMNLGFANRQYIEGDLLSGTFQIGGRIGLMDISGGLAASENPNAPSAGQVTIVTGTNGGSGDIGGILVGSTMNSSMVLLQTSSGSYVDRLIVGNNPAGNGQITGGTQNIRTGLGSNVRFVDFAGIQRTGDQNVVIPLVFGQAITLVDDSGSTVTFSITPGGGLGNGPNFATSAGNIYVLPINGSEGVAIARVAVNLVDGANLVITSSSDTPGSTVEIGHIIAAVSGTGNSNINIGGTAETDVWNIETGGGFVNQIRNSTPGGDIVQIDSVALNSIQIDKGNLGSTQTHGIGPSRLGSFMGIAQPGQAGGAIRSPFSLPQNAITNVMNVYNPIDIRDYTQANASLEDIGSPIDPYLNGVVVRNGDLVRVTVAGSVGDVIVEQGDLLSLTANSDGSTATGGFDGIVGSIYANAIGTVDVGDGLILPGPSPFAVASITAADDIVRVISNRVQGATVSGVITAANINANAPRRVIGTTAATAQLTDIPANGIGIVEVYNGKIDRAFISGTLLDAFWSSTRIMDGFNQVGDVGTVLGVNSNLFRSTIEAQNITAINLQGGAYDATQVNATGSIGQVTADQFRNSLLLGSPSEYRASFITSTGNIGTIRTLRQDGDISDLRIDTRSSLSVVIEAHNFNRVALDADNTVAAVVARGSVRSSAFTAGQLVSMNIVDDLRLTSVNIAGPIGSIFTGGSIAQVTIASTGPSGRIDTIRAGADIDASITSSGRIVLVEAAGGSVNGSIRTTGTNATLQTLRASRDIIVDLLVLGNVNDIAAGGNIGDRTGSGSDSRTIDVRGNLDRVVSGGQIYTDILVGQTIGLIRNARVSALPGNDQVAHADIRAYGRIESLQLFGDFNGDIISESGGIGSIVITGGSFRQGNSIIAHDGSITRLTIIDGHLLGNVIADEDIELIELMRGSEHFTGHIGVASALHTTDFFKNGRNELPPGTVKDAGYNGVLIFAGRDIKKISVERGRMFESQIHADRNIDTVFIQGGVRNDSLTTGSGGSGITAGQRIGLVDLNGFAAGVIVAAGVTDLGADMRAGGTGADIDTVGSGIIDRVDFARRAANVQIAAGITVDPGTGRYNGADSKKTVGESAVNQVKIGMKRTNVSVFADGAIGSTPSNVTTGGEGLDVADPDRVVEGPVGTELVKDQFVTVTFLNGQKADVRLTGPGRLFFDQSTSTVAVLGTMSMSELTIRSNTAALTTLRVRSDDGGRLGRLTVEPALRGSSSVFIDDGIDIAEFGVIDTTGLIGTGKDIGTLSIVSFLNGSFEARDINIVNIAGDLGRSNVFNDATLKARDIGTFKSANLYGYVSSDRDIDVFTTGAVVNGGLRAGRTLASVTAASLTDARVIAGVELTTLSVAGDATRATIYAGGDLGRDVAFGGTGLNADTVTNGTIGTVNIGGNFRQSDIAAGMLRGQDGFLGTSDDLITSGRSAIGNVTIGGVQVGSVVGSESYRIASTGTIGTVRVGGNIFTSSGNLLVQEINASTIPVRVTDLRVQEVNRTYRAVITFNQPVNSATLSAALGVAEVRGGSTISLVEGTDYSITYNSTNNTVTVIFSQAVTSRDLPQTSGVPGPGVYRFTLDSDALLGQTVDNRLDGNADGSAGDDFSADAFVGDVGDKLIAGNPTDDPDIDFYGPGDLDEVMDNNYTPDGRPDINKKYTLRGTLGDHPDADPFTFSVSSDADVYKITLRAGQILRLSALSGLATNAARAILSAAGTPLFINTGMPVDVENAFLKTLPIGATDPAQSGLSSELLIKTSGVYYLVVAPPNPSIDPTDTNSIANIPPAAGATGTYEFTIEVFDDGDSGFRGNTDSGDGRTLVDAPLPSAFAGTDNVLGTSDDLKTVVINGFTFDLDRGADGVYGTKDDIVRGSDGNGATSERLSGRDNVFGTADDRVTTAVNAAIGTPDHVGLPSEANADVDVFHLNNGEAIATGTRMRITLRLTDLGANIGLPVPNGFNNGLNPTFGSLSGLGGNVQFGVFEVSGDTGFDDALLVASPSNVAPIGGQDALTIGEGSTTYGYDDNGDFYMEFVALGTLADPSVDAAYAVYVQGVGRSNYRLEVLTSGRRSLPDSTQNIFIELNGGIIDWLEAGDGVTTTLAGFDASSLGFSGIIGSQTAGAYIVSQLISNLNALFAASNVDVRISSNPRDFEGQSFSTVFLSSSIEPTAFFNDGTFGYSEHVDPLNTDPTDQAVVFLPQIGRLDFDPTQEGADFVAQALTAAVGRRIGELVGLRLTSNELNNISPVDIMAANSVTTSPGPSGVYRFLDDSISLSDRVDTAMNPDSATRTNFFLGHQNSHQLLDRIMATP